MTHPSRPGPKRSPAPFSTASILLSPAPYPDLSRRIDERNILIQERSAVRALMLGSTSSPGRLRGGPWAWKAERLQAQGNQVIGL